jgi:uncharacterized DUF497 family protein
MLRFEWDETKNKSNFKKHGLWFEEATSVFNDPHGRLFFDRDHSNSEDRFVLIGSDIPGRMLVVVHLHRETERTVRIISARRATKRETKIYEERI